MSIFTVPRRHKELFLLSLLLTCNGCSFIFVARVPEATAKELEHRDVSGRSGPIPTVHCTSGIAAPLIDTLVAGYQVVRTAMALQASDSDYAEQPISRGADIAIGVGLTTLFTAAAAYGFSHTNECALLEKRLALGRNDDPELDRARANVWQTEAKAQRRAQRVPVPPPAVRTDSKPIPAAYALPANTPSETTTEAELRRRVDRARQRQKEATEAAGEHATRLERARQRQLKATEDFDAEPDLDKSDLDEPNEPPPTTEGAGQATPAGSNE